MTEAMFAFKMRAVQRRDDPYYVTRWDRAIPVEVVAPTKQDAIDKAATMLGESHRGYHWVFQVDSVRDTLIPAPADAADEYVDRIGSSRSIHLPHHPDHEESPC